MSPRLSRRRLVGLVGSSLVPLGGCLTTSTDDGPSSATAAPQTDTRPPSTTQSRTATGTATDATRLTPEECLHPKLDEVTPHPDPPTPSGTGQIPFSLEISSAYDRPLTVVLTEHESGKTTFARTYPAGEPIEVREGTRNWVAYDVTVRADCDVLWERLIGDSAGYELYVDSEGSVDVTAYYVA